MRVPSELIEYKQWVLWRRVDINGRVAKVPISPWSGKAAACDRPRTWSTFWHVRHAVRKYLCDGIGFVFTEADPFCGIDLDQCRTINGLIAPDVLELIKRFESYTELSPSGTGAHVSIRAKLPGKGRRTGRIEMYDSGRYFTMTGKHLSGTPLAIQNRQDVLDAANAELFAQGRPVTTYRLNRVLDVSDEKLIERAKNASGGERFQRLWQGDTSAYGNDHSRADLALCRMLAFWCGGDVQRVDRLFRRSGLMREKWDRRTGDSAYGVRTIKAILPFD